MTLSSNTKKSLDSYLDIIGFTDSTPNRLDLFAKKRFLLFFGPNKEGLNCINYMIHLANAKTNIVSRLKIMICLHHIVMSNNNASECILDQTIDGLEKYASSVQNGDATKWLCGLTHVYYKYIRKVCANNRIYWQTRTCRPFSKSESFQILTTRIYMMMNLIRTIFPIREFILNFGRYFKEDYPIIIDVNICIVEDMAVLYTGLVQIINHILGSYKTTLNTGEIKQLLTIVDQTYLIHEDLYILFYNRYYTRDVNPPYINWLKLEPEEYKELKNLSSPKRKVKMDGSIASIDGLDISQFQKTYFSHRRSLQQTNFEAIEI